MASRSTSMLAVQSEPLLSVAMKCRELAGTCTTDFAKAALCEMAIELEQRADAVRTVSSEVPQTAVFLQSLIADPNHGSERYAELAREPSAPASLKDDHLVSAPFVVLTRA